MKKIFFLTEADTNALFARVGTQTIELLKAEFPYLKEAAKPQARKYMSREQVCELLHISLPTLHRRVNSGVLPCYKNGRKTLFKTTEVETSLIKLNVEGGLTYER
jgi:excisionase family DNA binding protein